MFDFDLNHPAAAAARSCVPYKIAYVTADRLFCNSDVVVVAHHSQQFLI
jgi:hypothetical protein